MPHSCYRLVLAEGIYDVATVKDTPEAFRARYYAAVERLSQQHGVQTVTPKPARC